MSTPIPPNDERLVTFKLRRFFELSLREDKFIEIQLDEALYLSELDKNNGLYYVEFPSADNQINKPRLWNTKDWRLSLAKHEASKKRAVDDKVAWDNFKENLLLVADAMAKLTKQKPEICYDLAQGIMSKHPKDLSMLGVNLRQPYYQGDYIFLPFKPQ